MLSPFDELSMQGVAHEMRIYARARQPRVRNCPFTLDVRNRVLLVLIWLRMYPEVTVLSAIIMVSLPTVQREIRYLLPMLWAYFRQMVQWPNADQ